MKRILSLVLIALLAALPYKAYSQAGQSQNKTKIQIALMLDTSGSMDGLIEQAKTQLWKVVNEMSSARYNGQRPDLEIALYEYGNDNLNSKEGYLKMITNFTSDLDLVSEKLFALTTNGGEEYCGWVIKSSLSQLGWAPSNENLKMIFIAGNEPFTQGPVDFKKSCKSAIEKGIIVNTIFCGEFNQGVNTQWKEGADLADGKYMNISHNQKLVYIESPFDTEIMELNDSLNSTYIYYGSGGAGLKLRQETQDINAMGASEEALIQRAAAKSSANYKNASWDIVDATIDGDMDLEDISDDELPEEMKNMSDDEKKAYVEEKSRLRQEIQKKIKSLNGKRDKFVMEKRKELSEEATLDDAMITAIREQAAARNYTFTK